MKRRIIISHHIAWSCIIALLLGSCSDEADELPLAAASAIEVSASLDNLVQSRATENTVTPPKIENGTYSFTYPQSSGYVRSSCIFNAEGIGRIYPSQSLSPLEWDDLPSGPYDFILDNVISDATVTETITDKDDKKVVTTLGVELDGDNASAYTAAIEGTNMNDIVWGKATGVTKQTDPVNIDMSHRMSRLSVRVESDLNELKNGGKVTVKLTQTVADAAMFNRVDGKISLPSSPVYKEIVIVDNAPLTVVQNTDNLNMPTYTTPNLILPPQSLRTGNNRPRLEITIGEGENQKTYTGVLPAGMIYADGGYAATLEFRQGVHLELRVKKLSDKLSEPVILFLPALVRLWDDKGEYTVRTEECGVYTPEHLEAAIKAYNDKKIDDMRKYGWVQFKNKDDFYDKKNPTKYTVRLFASLANIPSTKFKTTDGICTLEFDMNGWSINGIKDWNTLEGQITE